LNAFVQFDGSIGQSSEQSTGGTGHSEQFVGGGGCTKQSPVVATSRAHVAASMSEAFRQTPDGPYALSAQNAHSEARLHSAQSSAEQFTTGGTTGQSAAQSTGGHSDVPLHGRHPDVLLHGRHPDVLLHGRHPDVLLHGRQPSVVLHGGAGGCVKQSPGCVVGRVHVAFAASSTDRHCPVGPYSESVQKEHCGSSAHAAQPRVEQLTVGGGHCMQRSGVSVQFEGSGT